MPILRNSLDIRNVDCMEMMREFPDKHFDLAIVDPPYGINWMKQIQNPNKGKNWKSHEYKSWDEQIPTAEYFDELRRLSSNQIIWGGNYFPLRPSRCWITWDKMQEFSGSEFEMAWVSLDAPTRAFRMSRVEAYAGTDKIHPTQKPVALYRWLLQNYATPGQRILDTHMGSGSIAIACHYSGNPLTACELDPDYFRDACARIERETAQADFLTPAPLSIAQPDLLAI